MPDAPPTPEELRRIQHFDIKAEVEKRLVANAENLDKAILTYSSGGLALSLGFLKDFVAVSEASLPILLYSSWALFVLAVTITLVSYLTSQFAQHRQLSISVRYNLQMEDAALNETNWPARLTEWASYLAGLAFILALASSTLFVAINLSKGSKMTEKKSERLIEGAPVPTLQQVPAAVQRGAPVPTIQTIPQPSAPNSAPTQAPAAVPVQPASGGSGASGTKPSVSNNG